jgi:hypothetical protein
MERLRAQMFRERRLETQLKVCTFEISSIHVLLPLLLQKSATKRQSSPPKQRQKHRDTATERISQTGALTSGSVQHLLSGKTANGTAQLTLERNSGTRP